MKSMHLKWYLIKGSRKIEWPVVNLMMKKLYCFTLASSNKKGIFSFNINVSTSNLKIRGSFTLAETGKPR